MFDYFDSTLTPFGIGFIIITLLTNMVVVCYGIKHYRFFFWRYIPLIFGVLCFEMLTSSFWQIEHLGPHSYLNGDISYIMTLAWGAIIMGAKYLYDRFFSTKNGFFEIGLVTIFGTVLGGVMLMLLGSAEIFSYSPLTQDLIQNSLTITGTPLEAIIYTPIFIGISYTFYKYWETYLYMAPTYGQISIRPIRDTVQTTIIICALGYLLHPLLIGSVYAYLFLITSLVIALVLLNAIMRSLDYLPVLIRFLLGVSTLTGYLSFMVSYLLETGHLTLANIAKNTYTANTFLIPGLSITDAELVGIIAFSILLIGVSKYLAVITHKDISIDEGNMSFTSWKSIFQK